MIRKKRNADAVLFRCTPQRHRNFTVNSILFCRETRVRQVGRENLVGQENCALLCMMRNLEIERVALAAMGLGIARCERKQLDVAICLRVSAKMWIEQPVTI